MKAVLIILGAFVLIQLMNSRRPVPGSQCISVGAPLGSGPLSGPIYGCYDNAGHCGGCLPNNELLPDSSLTYLNPPVDPFIG